MDHGSRLMAVALSLGSLLAVLTACQTSGPVASPTATPRSPPTATTTAPNTSAPTPTPTLTPTNPTQEPDGDSNGPVKIAVPEEQYRSGEEIAFTITNSSPSTIYYVYGCAIPTVQKIEDDAVIPLTVSNLESIPQPKEMKPGETHTCSWDQRVWQDPDKQGAARFRQFVELAQVPPGRYQLLLRYYLDREDALSFENPETTRSRIVSIE